MDTARIITRDMWGPPLPVVIGAGWCREVIGPRSGAELRSLYWFELTSGSSSVPLQHPVEAAYYVAAGKVAVRSTASKNKDTRAVPEGGMFHVRPFTDYSMAAVTDAVVIGGPAPVDDNFGEPIGASFRRSKDAQTLGVAYFHRDDPGLMVPIISADARLVVWYGVGAVSANMNYVILQPGERNKEHLHRYSEDTILILEGSGTAEDVTNGLSLEFNAGDVVTIPPGVVHAISANRGERIVSVGGPCPADLDMLRAVGVDVDWLTERLGKR